MNCSPLSQKDRRVFNFSFLLFADPRGISLAFHRARTPKSKTTQPSGNKMLVLTPRNQKIDNFCRLRSVSCLVLFHCRFVIPFDFTGTLNGNVKIIILCVLCISNERSEWAVKQYETLRSGYILKSLHIEILPNLHQGFWIQSYCFF
jgi:hypothetical protein